MAGQDDGRTTPPPPGATPGDNQGGVSAGHSSLTKTQPELEQVPPSPTLSEMEAELVRKAEARKRQMSGLRPYPKGVSGNPSGRSKDEYRIRALARSHAPEAVMTLVALMRKARSEKVRKEAADALLDRGFGKPGVSPELPDIEEWRNLSIKDEELDAILEVAEDPEFGQQ